jgi:hypothetical protein
MQDFAGATQYAGDHGYMPQCVSTRCARDGADANAIATMDDGKF